MNRKEFLENVHLTRKEMIAIAAEMRINAGKRTSPEAVAQFHNLDEKTFCEEKYVQTEYGKSHIYVIKKKGSGTNLPVFINIHGGGWTVVHGERDIYFCRRIVNTLSCVAIDVDYVLAPEYPYPAAIEELCALLQYVVRNAKEFDIDAARLVLCGQSSGGNLAAAVANRMKHDSDVHICRQILCYPPADNCNSRFPDDTQLTPRDEQTEYYGVFYNEKFEDRKNPEVSLVFADKIFLEDTPPTDIITAGLDNLREEAEKFFCLLQKASIPSTYKCFKCSNHGFAVNLTDEWQEAQQYIESLLKQSFREN